MRLASLESVRRSAAAALRRFPLSLLCAWLACAISDVLILGRGEHPGWIGIAAAAVLGVPACLAVALLGERLGGRAPRAMCALLQLVVLAAIAVFAWQWPHWTIEVQWRRYVQISILAHALTAFLPYLAVREPNGFWQYNRALLERFILATVFAGVLFGGLEGALGSLIPLFNIKVSPKAFALLGSWIWLVFHPWFFLAGVPEDLAALESRRDYPAVLRIFAQFILVPLVGVYQVLLTAYLVRVIATGRWPNGLIGWLVSAEAAGGVLTILLIHPVRERAENLWVRTFARGFYVALVPSLVMLALAIGKRVGVYGMTEDRYFVIALVAWLGAISLYFIVRRDGDIRWIPITLAALALITCIGPWSAYSVSAASQCARLERLLRDNGLWSANEPHVAIPTTHEAPYPVRQQLSSTLTYLFKADGDAAVRRILGRQLMASVDSGFVRPHTARGTERAQHVMAKLGLEYVNPWEHPTNDDQSFSLNVAIGDPRPATSVTGMEFHVRIDGTFSQLTAGARSLELSCDAPRLRLLLRENRAVPGARAPAVPFDTLAVIPVAPLIQEIHQFHGVMHSSPRVDFAGNGARGFVLVNYLNGSTRPEPRINGLGGDLYFSLTSPDTLRR
jgi:hypothetical protein